MPRGSKPTCECGACEKCRRRAYQREYQRAYRLRVPLTEEQRQRACERTRAWAAAHPEHAARAARLQRERNPEKVAARSELNHALARGDLARGVCEVCGSTPAEGHHDDYARPLDVRWLCKTHHAEHHREERQAA